MFYLAPTFSQFPITSNRPFPPDPYVWKVQTLPSNPATHPQVPNPALFIANMPPQSPLASGTHRNMDAALNTLPILPALLFPFISMAVQDLQGERGIVH